jgi:hypothetical protein
MDFANTNKALLKITEYFAEQMRINLGAKVRRKSYRSSWKNGKPYNTRIRTFQASHSASGNLINSISVIKSNKGYAVTIAKYGQHINDGRRKGKGIPIDKMQSWIKQRRLQPRNLQTGSFIANTSRNKKAMGFMMNRKIKHFGMEAFPFIKLSREATLYVFKDELKKSVKKDIYNNLGLKFKRKR